jgi:hypothetical protein
MHTKSKNKTIHCQEIKQTQNLAQMLKQTGTLKISITNMIESLVLYAEDIGDFNRKTQSLPKHVITNHHKLGDLN